VSELREELTFSRAGDVCFEGELQFLAAVEALLTFFPLIGEQAISAQLNELRLQVERLDYDNKEVSSLSIF